MTKTSLLTAYRRPCHRRRRDRAAAPRSARARRACRRHRHILDVGRNHQRPGGDERRRRAGRRAAPSMLGALTGRGPPCPAPAGPAMSATSPSSSAARAAPPARPRPSTCPRRPRRRRLAALADPARAPPAPPQADPSYDLSRHGQSAGPDPDLLGLRRACPARPARSRSTSPASPRARCRRPWRRWRIQAMNPPSAASSARPMATGRTSARTPDPGQRLAGRRAHDPRQLQPRDQLHPRPGPGFPRPDRDHPNSPAARRRRARRLAERAQRPRLLHDGDRRGGGPHDGDVELERGPVQPDGRARLSRRRRDRPAAPAARAAPRRDHPMHGAGRSGGPRPGAPR